MCAVLCFTEVEAAHEDRVGRQKQGLTISLPHII